LRICLSRSGKAVDARRLRLDWIALWCGFSREGTGSVIEVPGSVLVLKVEIKKDTS
jgi:hypothetical protein